jgi:hypothetical protein
MLPIALFMARAVRDPIAFPTSTRQDRVPSLALRHSRPQRPAKPRAAPTPACAPSRT